MPGGQCGGNTLNCVNLGAGKAPKDLLSIENSHCLVITSCCQLGIVLCEMLDMSMGKLTLATARWLLCLTSSKKPMQKIM